MAATAVVVLMHCQPTSQPASQSERQADRQTDWGPFCSIIDAAGLSLCLVFAIITVLLSEGSPLRALILIVEALKAGVRDTEV